MDRHTLIKKMINAQKALDRGQYQIAWNELYIPDSEIRRYCQWKRDEHHDFYETDCGQAYSLIDGSLKDNHIKFCHFCGKEILADTGKEPGEKGAKHETQT